MKRILLIIGMCLLAHAACLAQNNGVIRLQTPSTELVLNAWEGRDLQIAYFGARLNDVDFGNMRHSGARSHSAYPTYGTWCAGETAIGVTHANGSLVTDLAIESVETVQEASATVSRIRMKERLFPFYVTVCYRVYNDVDMIETWSEIENKEKKPVMLTRFDSGFLPFSYGDTWISHLYGNWANEGRVVQEPLEQGMKVIKNKDGARNSHSAHAEVMFSLDGKPQENAGRVIGAALCYSGNYELRIDTEGEWHRFFAGINPDNSYY